MSLKQSIYVDDPNKFVSFYEHQAVTGKDAHRSHTVQKGGGLGNTFGSLHSSAIPIEVHSKPAPMKTINPKIQSPSEGAVDRAKESVKRQMVDGPGEVSIITAHIKKPKRRKKVSRQKKGRGSKKVVKGKAKSKKKTKKRTTKKKLSVFHDIFSHGPIP